MDINNLTLSVPGLQPVLINYWLEGADPAAGCDPQPFQFRHISISPDSLSNAEAWFVAGMFGFVGRMCSCEGVWFEDSKTGNREIHLRQLINLPPPPSAAGG